MGQQKRTHAGSPSESAAGKLQRLSGAQQPATSTEQDANYSMSSFESDSELSALADALESGLSNPAPAASVAAARHATSQGKTKPAASDRLPAVRVAVNTEAASWLPKRIAKELERLFPTHHRYIKLASVRDGTLVIATDDKATHSQLTTVWPSDAFGGSFRPLKKGPRLFKVVLKVDPRVDIEDSDAIEELALQGITEAKRKFSHRVNAPSHIVKAVAKDRETFEKVTRQGVKLFFVNYRAERDDQGPTKCFKCQGFNHIAAQCRQGLKCL